MRRLSVILPLLLLSMFAVARTMRIYGYVTDEQNVGIEMVNVYLSDGITGTSTNQNGYYTLSIELNDTVWITYSMIGYTTIRQQFFTDRDVVNINVVLPVDAAALEEVNVTAIERQSNMMDRTDATITRTMPDATGGSIESLLITFAGVSQNNELSTQYNVRGGSFDENSVYVNGIEVHRPLLLRSGQQEGLSFVNPYMVESVHFSAGGFDACYGDKMSSVLDIRYKTPTAFSASFSLGLLGANAYVGWGDSTRTQMHGIRYKTSKYLLGMLPTQGNYQPNFVDYQTYMTWHLGHTPSPWMLSVLGNVSYNSYSFIPASETTSFGGLNQTLRKEIYYEGQERDRFLTTFLAVGAEKKLRLGQDQLSMKVDLSGFYTHEQETYDILSEYILSEKNEQDAPSSSSRSAVVTSDVTDNSIIGTGTFHEHARNLLQAGVVTLAYHGEWTRGANRFRYGASGQLETIRDQISEWEWRDSMGYSMPNLPHTLNLDYSMKGQTSILSGRLEAYVQDSYSWTTPQGKVNLTGGVRLNYWTYTGEVLCSPRASVVWVPGWKRDFTFRVSTGLYYQAPFYKELRDTVTTNGVTRIVLNQHLRAQRSVQLVMGADYYFRAWGRPFKFTAEAYGKYIDRMVSYTVENVRVRYSGQNDAEGYTLGVDLKLSGELVPGVDSWVSFSTMRSRMRFVNDPYQRGWIPAPQEQRWSLSFYFQDYIPRLPQYKLHLKCIFSEGLPYGYPRNEKMRYLSHMPAYKRIDIGASRTFSADTDRFMRRESARHVAAWSIYFEVFNVAGWQNVNNYYWVSAADGTEWASPNYLTSRMFNLRFTLDLK